MVGVVLVIFFAGVAAGMVVMHVWHDAVTLRLATTINDIRAERDEVTQRLAHEYREHIADLEIMARSCGDGDRTQPMPAYPPAHDKVPRQWWLN